MTYKEARVYLDEVSKYGSVLGLDTIRGLLDELGNPQDDLKFIHIAGTNGKGSVLAYLSTILSEAGFRTGRYVSPTVVSYLEKIQVDGSDIPEVVFTELVEEVQKAIVRMETDGKARPTVFEIETAIAFLYFRNMHCEYVVLETGLGGSTDATNIVKTTEAAVFATISRDHMGFLGDTLEEIAENKAGIIKPGCTVISAAQPPEVRRVLEKRAAESGCPIRFAEPEKAQLLKESYRGQVFSYKTWNHVQIHLAGKYQVLNAVTVCEAVDALCEKQKTMYPAERLTETVVRNGFSKTIWAGRFTCIQEEPVFIVDGAHNEDAARQLRETVEAYFPGKRLIYIMGVFKDKEYEKITELMIPLAKRVYTVSLPNVERTLDAEALRQVVESCWQRLDCGGTDRRAQAAASIKEAVRLAKESAERDDVILAFGSLSYLGEVMQEVGGKIDDRL